jgi:hypothetical protein
VRRRPNQPFRRRKVGSKYGSPRKVLGLYVEAPASPVSQSVTVNQVNFNGANFSSAPSLSWVSNFNAPAFVVTERIEPNVRASVPHELDARSPSDSSQIKRLLR